MEKLEEKTFNQQGDCIRENVFLEGLLARMEDKKESDPVKVKSKFLQITQLSFDGMIDGRRDKYGRTEFLEWLMEIGTIHIGNFYRNKLNPLEIINDIKEHSESILKYGEKTGIPKPYHLMNEEKNIYNFALEAQKKLGVPDTIVPVANEGFEPAFLMASIYNDAGVFPMRDSCSKADRQTRIARGIDRRYLKETFRNKKVLVVEGTVFSGESLLKVCKRVLKERPSILEFCTVKGSLNKDRIEGYLNNYFIKSNVSLVDERFGYINSKTL